MSKIIVLWYVKNFPSCTFLTLIDNYKVEEYNVNDIDHTVDRFTFTKTNANHLKQNVRIITLSKHDTIDKYRQEICQNTIKQKSNSNKKHD